MNAFHVARMLTRAAEFIRHNDPKVSALILDHVAEFIRDESERDERVQRRLQTNARKRERELAAMERNALPLVPPPRRRRKKGKVRS